MNWINILYATIPLPYGYGYYIVIITCTTTYLCNDYSQFCTATYLSSRMLKKFCLSPYGQYDATLECFFIEVSKMVKKGKIVVVH